MTDKKQSSIDYLAKRVAELHKKIVQYLTDDEIEENITVLQQAKAMHQQEIEDAYADGYDACHSTGISARQYFEQTFKND